MKQGGEIHAFVSRRVREMHEDKVTVRAMAKRLGVDRCTIYRWIKQGLI